MAKSCGCAIVGEDGLKKIALRYMGIGKELSRDETEILLFSLYMESEARGGLIASAKIEADQIWAASNSAKVQRAILEREGL